MHRFSDVATLVIVVESQRKTDMVWNHGFFVQFLDLGFDDFFGLVEDDDEEFVAAGAIDFARGEVVP